MKTDAEHDAIPQAEAAHLAQDAPNEVPPTQVPRDRREARLRALFALLFHESGLEPPETTISALAAAAVRNGYDVFVGRP